MKANQFTRQVAIFAFAVLALAACKSATPNTNNSNNTSNTPGNTNTATPTAVGDYSSPTAAFKTLYEATKANNIEGIKRSMSKKVLELMTKAAAKENKSLDQSLKDTTTNAPPSFPETRNEKIDGDKATLEYKDDKTADWQTAWFAKENGEWKFAISDEAAAAMEIMDHMGEEKK